MTRFGNNNLQNWTWSLDVFPHIYQQPKQKGLQYWD